MRQLGKLVGTEMQIVGNDILYLDFQFASGTCTNFNDQSVLVAR